MVIRILDNTSGTAFTASTPCPLFLHDAVYFLTGSHEEAERAASWCSLHDPGDIYRCQRYTIQIMREEDRK